MTRSFNVQDQNAWFKQMYAESSETVVNKVAPLASLLLRNKKADWVGDKFHQPLRFGFGVGLGYRPRGANLPTPVAPPIQDALIQAKRAYATAEWDREAIVASRSDKGAFGRATVENTEATVEGFHLHMIERALFSDGSGKLAEVDGVDSGAGSAGSPWILSMEDASAVAPNFKARYFPIGAHIDLYSQAGVYQLTVAVVSADQATNKLRVVMVQGGAQTSPTAGDIAYWEGNKDGECVGLKNICPDTAGTLHGISQTDYTDMRGGVLNLNGGSLSYDDINGVVEAGRDRSGLDFTMGITSAKGMTVLKNLSEDLKRYNTVEVKTYDGKAGFKGIEIITGSGSFGMISSQMCPDDEMYFGVSKHLQLVMRQDFGWFDDDGTILLRDQNKDLYAARFGGYFEAFCNKPNAFYRIKNFAVPAGLNL